MKAKLALMLCSLSISLTPLAYGQDDELPTSTFGDFATWEADTQPAAIQDPEALAAEVADRFGDEASEPMEIPEGATLADILSGR